MHWARQREQRPLLAAFGAVLLVTVAIGTWAGGQRGAATAIGGVAIGVVTIGLLGIVIVPMIEDGPVEWAAVFGAAFLVVGGLTLVQRVLLPDLGNTGELVTIAVLGTSGGAGAGFVGGDDVVRGAGYGLFAGALGGFLIVPIATYESFAMQPALDGIVLLSGIVGPLVFGVLGGIGGAIGGRIAYDRPHRSDEM